MAYWEALPPPGENGPKKRGRVSVDKRRRDQGLLFTTGKTCPVGLNDEGTRILNDFADRFGLNPTSQEVATLHGQLQREARNGSGRAARALAVKAKANWLASVKSFMRTRRQLTEEGLRILNEFKQEYGPNPTYEQCKGLLSRVVEAGNDHYTAESEPGSPSTARRGRPSKWKGFNMEGNRHAGNMPPGRSASVEQSSGIV
ncbi:hypothetical protein CC2G_008626 [Coprinopsis cinerea AmutBmut pab1-1]|nr:hypothetical protein CC2G_008626 [Coprinopsis cinerea AmutBmut pab1-1]